MDKQEFIEKAAEANAFEIETSRIAAEAAEDDEVVELAEMMIEDHTKAAERLGAAIGRGGAPAAELDGRHKEQLDRLKELSGAELDAEYVRLQVVAHDEAVELFASFVDEGQDGPVGAFARETLPILRRHQDAILDIFEEIGG